MKKLLFCVATLAGLSACGDSVKETLGIDRRAPDEFRVVSRPPLSVPPQFDLRPPGVEGMNGSATREQAESLVLGDTAVKPVTSKPVGKTTGKSAADNVFLQKAGVGAADPNIKQELAEKRMNDQIKQEDKGFWDRISPASENKEPIVKAQSEADRIKKNKAEGKPVTEGETPDTGGGVMSTLEHWFGSW